jgi:aryl sulfotransferase
MHHVVVAQPVRYRNVLMDSARWDEVSLRDGDIIISTPPKAGTTWLQMIYALLVFRCPGFSRPLEELSPWVDLLTRSRGELRAWAERLPHRRFFKTHTPLDGLPSDARVTYLCVGRDPRDAAVSWDNHMANADFGTVMGLRAAAQAADGEAGEPPPAPPEVLESPRERFWEWVDNPDSMVGLAWTLHHLSTFWPARGRANVVMLHYDDLRTDLAGQMREIAARLGIDIPDDRWPELVRAATFDHMQRRAAELAPEPRFWYDRSRFFRRGASGQWREVIGPDELPRYAARVAALADPDLSEWVHRGPIAA